MVFFKKRLKYSECVAFLSITTTEEVGAFCEKLEQEIKEEVSLNEDEAKIFILEALIAHGWVVSNFLEFPNIILDNFHTVIMEFYYKTYMEEFDNKNWLKNTEQIISERYKKYYSIFDIEEGGDKLMAVSLYMMLNFFPNHKTNIQLVMDPFRNATIIKRMILYVEKIGSIINRVKLVNDLF